MTQATNLAILNGAGASKTFNPVPLPNQVTGYENRESGVIETMPMCSVSIRRPRPGVRNPVYRVLFRTRVVEPQVVGVAASGIVPPVKAATTGWSNHEFVVPSSFSAVLRADLLSYSVGFLGHAQVKAAVLDLDQAMA